MQDGLIDVVIPLSSESAWPDNNELRFTLRAIEKNLLDLGRVFVCGHKPSWLTGVVHLDVPDKHRSNKDANLINKLRAACQAGCSERFVRSSDDEVLLAPCHASDLLPYHVGPLGSKDKAFWKGGWKARMRHTFDTLVKHGETSLHFDTHLPKVYERTLFLELCERYDYETGKGFCIDTWYFNHVLHPVRHQLRDEKLRLEDDTLKSAEAIRKKIAGRKYLGYNDAGLTPGLKQVLQELFPEPSRFETEGISEVVSVSVPIELDATLPQVVAVIGPPRSGTSCTAGLIHALGVSMGDKLRRPAPRNPRGFYEDEELRAICAASVGAEKKTGMFRQWAAKRGGKIIGGKDGKLCNQVPIIAKAWPGLKVIAVDRPFLEVAASMMKAGTFKRLKTLDGMEKLARDWRARRDRDLESLAVPTLRVSYRDVIHDTQGTISRIVAFLGIEPSDEQIHAAMNFVDIKLQHNRIDSGA